VIPGPKEPKKQMNIFLRTLMEQLKELWQGVYAYDSYLKCSGQSMIIWYMTNLSPGMSMVNSIIQYAWMTLMHLDWSTMEKSLSLIVIKNSFP
jgi:hypothetical protein